jgi:hypothetical protein
MRPLTVCFRFIWWITRKTNGVSALDLQQVLGSDSYQTARLHMLRRVMIRPCSLLKAIPTPIAIAKISASTPSLILPLGPTTTAKSITRSFAFFRWLSVKD